jgi:hypothetical protein
MELRAVQITFTTVGCIVPEVNHCSGPGGLSACSTNQPNKRGRICGRSFVAALPQRSVKSLFPAQVVDAPENLRFVSPAESRGPHLAVAFVVRDI